jgi:hypothetical protein
VAKMGLYPKCKMTEQKLKMNLRGAEENDFCILVCNFDFLSLNFDISLRT